jgi:ABC-2 type transport system ATP-binding protein
MIEVKNLTKKYGDRVAVDGISFSVNKGEILGFLGQNGAGKTTTMKILTCFMPATEGTVTIAGFDVFEQPMEVKKRIGYLPEVPPLYLELLVGEYLSFIADLRGVPKAEKAKKIDAALGKCNLGDVRNRLIGNLSKGYRQRIGIAQALLHDPDVLILDEPTVGLDPKQVTEARGLIKNLRTEHTVIYSTHILSEVAASCDRIIVIDRGKIVAQEAINSMGATGNKTRTELIVQKIDEKLLSSVRNIPGVSKVENISNGSQRLVVESEPTDALMVEIAKVVVGQGAGLVRMTPMQQGLEEYYLNLISGKRSML